MVTNRQDCARETSCWTLTRATRPAPPTKGLANISSSDLLRLLAISVCITII